MNDDNLGTLVHIGVHNNDRWFDILILCCRKIIFQMFYDRHTSHGTILLFK
jgi:hypothetical protein